MKISGSWPVSNELVGYIGAAYHHPYHDGAPPPPSFSWSSLSRTYLIYLGMDLWVFLVHSFFLKAKFYITPQPNMSFLSSYHLRPRLCLPPPSPDTLCLHHLVLQTEIFFFLNLPSTCLNHFKWHYFNFSCIGVTCFPVMLIILNNIHFIIHILMYFVLSYNGVCVTSYENVPSIYRYSTIT